MIATQNQQALRDAPEENETALSKFKQINQSLLLTNRVVTHQPGAGLNPLVDAAGYLFSVLGKLKQLNSCRQLGKLQKELIQEVNAFQEALKNQGYNAEYIIIARYVICATIDDVLSNTSWGDRWNAHSLLTAFNQDSTQQDKFFTIMERTIKEPAAYIDLMELMYICLSLGYKGQLRSTEHNQYQLEQITSNLYKHIRAFRGNVTKNLSPTPLKTPKAVQKSTVSRQYMSYAFIFCVTACIIMAIFVSLGYLMDVISNEAYKNWASDQTTVPAKPTN